MTYQKKFRHLNPIFILFLLIMVISADASEQVIQSNTNHVLVEYIPQNVQLREEIVNGKSYQISIVDDAELMQLDGKPQLPAYRINVGLPVEGEVRVNLIESPYHEINNVDILPGGANKDDPNPNIYQRSAYYPDSPYTVEIGMWRNQRIAAITLYPVQYHPTQQTIRVYDRFLIEVVFENGDAINRGKDDGFESLYQSALVNYETAKNWRVNRMATIRTEEDPFDTAPEWYKIEVNEEGMIRLTYEMLNDVGLPVNTLVPRTLRIYYGGGRPLPESILSTPPTLEEIPIQVTGEDDGIFDEEDEIIFWGQAISGWEANDNGNLTYYDHRYANHNAYWLTYGGDVAEGKRINSRDGSPSGNNTLVTSVETAKREEEDFEFVPQLLDKEYIWWTWHFVPHAMQDSLPRADTTYFYVDIENPDPSQSATLDLRVYGYRSVTSTVYHRLLIYFNDVLLADQDWETRSPSRISLMMPTKYILEPGMVQAGQNELRLVHSHDAPQIDPIDNNDEQYINHFELYYHQYLTAVGDVFTFHSSETTGTNKYQIDGFTSDDIRIFDITDPFAVEEIHSAEINQGTVTFQDENTAPHAQKYTVLTSEQYKSPLSIIYTPINHLRQEPTGSFNTSYIIITLADYYDNIEPLVTQCFNQTHNVKFVTLDEVYNEFSWGVPDVTAIRNFVMYAMDNWQAQPEYILLVGDGDYDFRNYKGPEKDKLPSYYIKDSFDAEDIVPIDDWYAYVIDSDMDPDVVMGRMPANSSGEIDVMVNKIIKYRNEPDYGIWKNTVIMAADDEREKESTDPIGLGHVIYTETMLYDFPQSRRRVVPYSIDKVKTYMTEFSLEAGGLKPKATDDLIEKWNKGGLLVNWVGHGNYEVWAHERLFHGSDISKLENDFRLPVMTSFSCDVGRYDGQDCLAEKLLRADRRGALACIASARTATSSGNDKLNRAVYESLFYTTPHIGKALLLGKLDGSVTTQNSQRYLLFGDPSMPLALPQSQIHIENHDSFVLERGQVMTVSGDVLLPTGETNLNFNGSVTLRVMDPGIWKEYTHLDRPGDKTTYFVTGRPLYLGDVDVINGHFEGQFIVPLNARLGDLARMTCYAWDDSNQVDAAGYVDSLACVINSEPVETDSTGPLISLFYDGVQVTQQTLIPEESELVLVAEDEHGINITGEEGRQIAMQVDEQGWVDISNLFQYHANSYQEGSIAFSLESSVREGEHLLTFRISDNYGNVSETTIEIVVVDQLTEAGISYVYNYPNPFSDETRFTTGLLLKDDIQGEFVIKIFTVAGRKIKEIKANTNDPTELVWDGRDDDGDEVANGTYIYKFIVKLSTGKTVEKIGKAVVLR